MHSCSSKFLLSLFEFGKHNIFWDGLVEKLPDLSTSPASQPAVITVESASMRHEINLLIKEPTCEVLTIIVVNWPESKTSIKIRVNRVC